MCAFGLTGISQYWPRRGRFAEQLQHDARLVRSVPGVAAAQVSAAIGYRATIGPACYRATIGNVTAMAQASATALPNAATSG
jgi:hypothetical protein